MGVGICCCSTPCGHQPVVVTGCPGDPGFPSLFYGPQVYLTYGGTTFGPYTSATNVVNCPLFRPPATFGSTSVSVTVVPPAGATLYQTTTATTFSVCSETNSNFTVSLNPATGYTCAGSCCPQTGPPYHAITYPTTATFTDAFGAITLTGGGTNATWQGCAMRTAAFGVRLNTTTGIYESVANLSVPVLFVASCGQNTSHQPIIGVSCVFGTPDSVMPDGTVELCYDPPSGDNRLPGYYSGSCPTGPPCGFWTGAYEGQCAGLLTTCPPSAMTVSLSSGTYNGNPPSGTPAVENFGFMTFQVYGSSFSGVFSA